MPAENPTLNRHQFFLRLKRIYHHWQTCDTLQSVDAMAIACGRDDGSYKKSISLQTYLFGYELGELIIVFCKESIAFLTAKRKIEFLRPIENAKENVEDIPAEIQLLLRDKEDKDAANYQKLADLIKDSGKGKQIGCFVKEKYDSDFVNNWKSVVKKNDLESIDVSTAFASLFATKDDTELGLIKKAADMTCTIYQKCLKEAIIDAIDGEKKVKHAKLTQDMEHILTNKKYVPEAEQSDYELCYPAIIQSGGNYALKFSGESDKNNLHFGNIICSIGFKYKSYCSNVVRMVLVEPSKRLQDIYTLLLDTEEAILKALIPGAKLCDVYEAGVQFVRSKEPELIDKLTKNFGFAIGLEFREPQYLISAKNQTAAEEGMTFTVCVGFANVDNPQAKDDAGKKVAFFIGDTVLVNKDGPAQSLTENAKKRVKSACLFFKDEDEADAKQDEPDVLDALIDQHGRSKRSTVIVQDKMRGKLTNEEKRKIHQKELADALNDEARARIAQAKEKTSDHKARKNNISYKNTQSIPQESEIRNLKIFVDKKYETIILPIYGVSSPFHISMIKNISQSVEGDHTYLRINFHHPGATMFAGQKDMFPNPDATYLKELTYRSSNIKEPGEMNPPSSNLSTAFRLIKEVQKKFKTREAEEKEKEGIVKQDKLVLSTGRSNPRLKGLYVKPNIVQKRLSGFLEAHVNGFRYQSIRGDKVDILYNNIKHAFFQSCDHEMIIILHFHLKHAILYGKKKHTDIQFFTEVGETTTDLGKHSHMADRDDLRAEQLERETRHKLNMAFKMFCEKVEKLTNQEVEFDTPFRELGFSGVPGRSSVLLQPTSGCLVQLTEWPVFIVTLDEVELVHFERVMLTLKNFDMVFIYKDYTRKPNMVASVPMNLLDHVKEWLNSCDIRYTEGIQSLNWPKIMKTIVDDPDGFFEGGGWKFLDADSGSEHEDEESEEEDENYRPTDDEEEEGSGSASGEGSGSDSDENYESEASDSVSGEEELSSDAESGKSWSELEEEAKKHDRENDAEVPLPNSSTKIKSKHSTHHSKPSLPKKKRK